MFSALKMYGTPQAPDIVIYQGEAFGLHRPTPIISYFQRYPERRLPPPEIIITGNLRGYIARYEFIDSVLYLTDIQGRGRGRLREFFPSVDEVRVYWFSGLLVLHRTLNNQDNYVILELENGVLKRSKRLFGIEEYREFLEKQFQAFKQTEEYQAVKEQLREHRANRHRSDEDVERIVRRSIIGYTSKILVE